MIFAGKQLALEGIPPEQQGMIFAGKQLALEGIPESWRAARIPVVFVHEKQACVCVYVSAAVLLCCFALFIVNVGLS